MMLQVIAYALAVSTALALMGFCLERLAVHLKLPRRAAWLVAMTASVLFPLAVVSIAPPRVIFETPIVQVGAPPEGLLQEKAQRPSSGPRVAAPVSTIAPASLPTGQVAASRPSISAGFIILWAWLLCSVMLAVYLLQASVRLRRCVARLPREVVQGAQVIVSDATGPALFGVWRPHVIVPRWFLAEAPQTQQLILEHELQHIRARDPLLLWAGVFLVVAVPWNLPLWWQLHRLRLAIELDCDGRVLRSGAAAEQYGEVLLSVTRRAPHLSVGLIAMSEPVSALERRIQNLTLESAKRSLWRAVVSLGLGCIGIGAAAALDAPAIRTVVVPRPSTVPVLLQVAPVTAQSALTVTAHVTAAASGPAAVTQRTTTATAGALLASTLPALQVGAAVPMTSGAIPPLLPAVVPDQRKQLEQIQPIILQKYPEILTPPGGIGIYLVAISLRADGTIRTSQLRVPTSESLAADRENLEQSFSRDGGWPANVSLPKGAKLANGAELPATLLVMYQILPSGYDESRAMSKVEEAVRGKYDNLLKPDDSETLNRITVLMTEDGQIGRDYVDAVDIKQRLAATGGADRFRAFRAMGLEPEQLAFVGGTVIYRRSDGAPGRAGLILDSNGIGHKQPEDLLLIEYAWPRRASESASAQQPSLTPPGYAAQEAVRTALVEKYFPDEFKPGSVVFPDHMVWFVLSPTGQVVRTGRVKLAKGQAMVRPYLQSLAPDLKLGDTVSMAEVRNAAGERANAVFTWMAP